MYNAMGLPKKSRILHNYGLLLDILEQLKVEKNSHAQGLLEKLESSTTVLDLTGPTTDSYWHGGSNFLSQRLHRYTKIRGKDSFTKEHDLKDLQIPRKPSKRFSGLSEVFQARNAEEYYRRVLCCD
ncbi:hypothetical protein PR048_014863 [Dryococelus australis]|uniref:Uncharacterized protein n=1 Tax=Dryococelus australis TaxID=614101 RepID=A0ABQ9HFI1_9NEOP|nr:hypothetical protein PR048_014863 [Dryococelus australis]